MPVCAALPRCYAAAVERSGGRLMIHANLVDGGGFFGVAALTLLLMVFLIAGLALAVIGGGMFFGAGQDVTVCSNQVLAICSDGFVVLHTAQLLGGALAVGGIGLVATAIVLALR